MAQPLEVAVFDLARRCPRLQPQGTAHGRSPLLPEPCRAVAAPSARSAPPASGGARPADRTSSPLAPVAAPAPWRLTIHRASARRASTPTRGDASNRKSFAAVPRRGDAGAGAVPEQELDPVGPLGAEDVDHARERLLAQLLLDQRGEPVDALPEVDRPGGDEHAERRRRQDHAEALTARSTAARVRASAPRRTRTTAPATSISTAASRAGVGGDAVAGVGSSRTGTKDDTASPPAAARRCRAARRQANSCCGSIRAGAPPRRPWRPGRGSRPRSAPSPRPARSAAARHR